MIDSAGTLCKAAAQIKKFGARRVFAFASHGIFSGPANERIRDSALEQVVVINSIPLTPACAANPKIIQLSIAPLLGKYSKRRRSNVAVIIVRIDSIRSFFFYCLLLNHSFPTNPNRITNCFKLFSLFTNLQLHCSCVAF